MTRDVSRVEAAPSVAPRVSSSSEISSAFRDDVPSSSMSIAIRAVPASEN